jgi:hypothetical protein
MSIKGSPRLEKRRAALLAQAAQVREETPMGGNGRGLPLAEAYETGARRALTSLNSNRSFLNCTFEPSIRDR